MEPGFIQINLNTVLTILASGLILWAIKRLAARLDLMSEKIGIQNGRITKLETWQAGHEKQDDERHEAQRAHVSNLWTELRRVETEK